MSSIKWVESNFDYIIIDEAHYLFQDALFNRNTEIMLDMVEQLLTDTNRERKHGSGVGVINVHKRIRLRFGKPYGLEIESMPDE